MAVAVQVDQVQTVLRTLDVACSCDGIGTAGFLRRHILERLPLAAFQLALYLHEPVVLTVELTPRDTDLVAVGGRLEVGWRILARRGGHEVVPAVVAQARVHRGIVFAGRRQLAVLIKLRRVALAVPVVVALHVVPAVQIGTDAL